MIIGISGKIGSGKDTVGKIIQYLTSDDCSKKYLGLLKLGDNIKGYHNSNWQIKKLADKLKDIVCLLIGCTREQLENETFKNKELGEEWRVWYMTHYKLSNINSNSGGKIGKIYPSKEALLEYESSDFFKNLKLDGYQIVSKVLTPRLLLQLIGTECGKNIIHPNIWINSLFNEYKPLDIQIAKIRRKGFNTILNNPNWIITDMRFPNELESIRQRDGIIIRVNRDTEYLKCLKDPVYFVENYIRTNKEEKLELRDIDKEFIKRHFKHLEHNSETALDGATFDYTIDNNDTIEELIEKVKEILIKEKIILC